jgi:flagellar motor switch protein FliN
MSSSPNSSSSFDLAAPQFRIFHDVLCDIDIVLGSGTMSVRECLALKKHSVIRLQQTAGSDLQVVVNGIGIAQGEVVIIDDSVAIRITEILPPSAVDACS